MTSRKEEPSAVPRASPAEIPAKPKYQPTAEEKLAIERDRERLAERRPAPRMKFEPREFGLRLRYDHEDQQVAFTLLSDALATTESEFVDGILSQLVNAARREGKVDESAFNFMLAVIKGVKPRDQVESMLAAQMAVIHDATMTLARRLNKVENIAQQDSALNGLTKLARTFATLVEALKRYRHGGEQKVTVQHVNVNDGGQAIVGNVAAQAKASPAKIQVNTPAAPPALTHSAEAPMPMLDERQAEPVSRDGAKETKANGRKRSH